MSTIFRYRWTPEHSRLSTLVIFTAQPTLDDPDFWDAINEDTGKNLSPDRIIIVVRDDIFTSISRQLSTMAGEPADWRVDTINTPVILAGFDFRGGLATQLQVLGPADELTSAQFEELKHSGTLSLFKTRTGLLLPSASTHYIHPSGRHSRGFLRTANLLIEGPEVSFLAMCLLSRLPSEVSYLWVDTSSISSLAYALVTLRHEMMPGFSLPVVNSFSSYDRLDRTRFGYHAKSLVLVSATTSGNLSRKLVEKGFPVDRVVTLFSLAQDTKDLSILCNLAEDDEVNPGRTYSATADFRATECPMCKAGSKGVRFVGDQFLADAIVYQPYTILATDAPKTLSPLMERYAGKRAFGIRARRSQESDANELWVDTRPLMKDDVFLSRIHTLVDRYAPASATLIVHSDDQESQDIAQLVKSRLRKTIRAKLTVCGPTELSQLTVPFEGSVIVTMACTGSGRAAQSISRALREVSGDNPRLYVSGFCKHSHTESYARLKSDLIYSHLTPKHEFVSAATLSLPVLAAESPWTRERAVLTKIREEAEVGRMSGGDELVDIIQARLDVLGELSKGGITSLYLPDASGSELRLRQTFAFWSFRYSDRDISQGDVFTTMACILESLRSGDTPSLVHTNFHHSLLSPACFGRYNDGVIQASLLRAALPQELNYAADDQSSDAMSAILRSMAGGRTTPRGEALAEFVLSLATRRMTLAPPHLADFLSSVPSNEPLLHALATYCQSELLTPH